MVDKHHRAAGARGENQVAAVPDCLCRYQCSGLQQGHALVGVLGPYAEGDRLRKVLVRDLIIPGAAFRAQVRARKIAHMIGGRQNRVRGEGALGQQHGL